jgi:hypothetical protein
VTVSPLTPSWIDASSGKGARLDHLVGLGVEFTCASGAAAWVGTPFHDHARVSFAVKERSSSTGHAKAKIKNADRRAWYQKMTPKQWQGISHQIDDSLRSLANQSLERLKGGGGDADLEKRKMIEARIRAAEMVKQDIPKERKTRMPFRSTLQQTLLRKRSTMEAALREAVAKKGITMLQLTCMHDLGITTSRNLSLQDQELLLDAPEWRALLQAEFKVARINWTAWPRNKREDVNTKPKGKRRESTCVTRKGRVSFVAIRTPYKCPRN